MITVYKTDGSVVEHAGQELSLEWMQQQVGGYIEIVRGRRGDLLVVNEEGKLINPDDVNEAATEWFYNNRGYYDYICGDAILVTPPDTIE